jgi:hypothetical protein
VFGYFLHHFPYFGMRGEQDAADLRAASERMHEIYEREFGEVLSSGSAWCMAAEPQAKVNSAWCMAAKTHGSAWCMAAKPFVKSDSAWCMAATAQGSAWCMAAKPLVKSDSAWCMAAKVA